MSPTTKIKLNCEFCSYTSSFSELKQHLRIHPEEKPYECVMCGFKSGRRYTVKRHMRTHTGEKPFPCKVCKEAVTRPEFLNRHLMKFHQLFRCLYCKEQFDSKEGIVKHQGISLENSCKKYDKVFLTPCELRKHLQMHTSEKPFKCETCAKSFLYQCKLKAHQRMHSKKSFECEICEACFPGSDSLKRHMYNHSDSM